MPVGLIGRISDDVIRLLDSSSEDEDYILLLAIDDGVNLYLIQRFSISQRPQVARRKRKTLLLILKEDLAACHLSTAESNRSATIYFSSCYQLVQNYKVRFL